MTNRVRIDHKRVEEARRALLKLANIEDQHEDISAVKSKLVLATRISPEEFQCWWQNKDGKVDKVKIMYMNGSIIATELASAPHSAAVAYVCQAFALQDNHHNLVLAFPEHDVTDANGQHVSSDVLIKVNDGNVARRANLSLVTAVVEVGVSQGVPELHGRLNFYSNIPSVQIYAVLKKYAAGGMLAMVFTRGANIFDVTSIWSFGRTTLHHSVIAYLEAQNWMGVCTGPEFGNAPVCDLPNLPHYRLQLPAATLLIGRPGGVPVWAPQMYEMDLFEVQDAFLTD